MAALAPDALPGGAGRVRRSTGRRSRSSGRSDGYPSDPAYLDYHRQSMNGMRLWSIGGEPYDPEAAAERAPRARVASSPPRSRRGSTAFAGAAPDPGLVTFAIDTELLGHVVERRGPTGFARSSTPRRAHGVQPRHARRGARRATSPRRAPAARLELGRGQGPARRGTRRRSPTSPGGRGGSSCALLRELGGGAGSAPAAAQRAARELLAVQASDWAFLDSQARGGRLPVQAGRRPRRGDARGHRLRARPRIRACAASHPTSASRRCSSPRLSHA